MADNKRCGTCRYSFFVEGYHDYDNGWSVGDHLVCRRFPPQIAPRQYLGKPTTGKYFPRMGENESCGEWAVKVDKASWLSDFLKQCRATCASFVAR